MKVIFSHGKESGPWGSKITRLAEVARSERFQVDSIDYTDLQSLEARVERLLSVCKAESGPLVLVGSSMGGYVATLAAAIVRPAGLFLMAPAFFLPGYETDTLVPGTPNTLIIHGWGDDIVPVDNSIRFAREHRVELCIVAGDHQLTANLLYVAERFRGFLKTCGL